MSNLPEGVQEQTALRLFELQQRCIECGGTFGMQLHHRIFRSEGENGLFRFLLDASLQYKISYDRDLKFWHLHDIQNLCVLCLRCHEGNGTGVHSGNEQLRQKLRNSFTDPITGFSISYFKEKTLW